MVSGALQAGWLRATPPMTSLPFDRVFTDHVRYAGRTLRYLGVAEADLDDACQEVFIVVHRRIHELTRPEGVRAWIRQVCVHVAQNARRSVRRRRDGGEAPPDIPTPATQDASIERTELRQRLLAILDRLNEDQRAVFVLYEIEQLTMAEVASAVDCPLQTAYSRLHAARAHVQQAIAQQEVSP